LPIQWKPLWVPKEQAATDGAESRSPNIPTQSWSLRHLGGPYVSAGYVAAIMHRGPKGFEAVGDDGASHGLFSSQKEAAPALQQIVHGANKAAHSFDSGRWGGRK
jgi:hypothetical protein